MNNLNHEYSLTLNGSLIKTNGTVIPNHYMNDIIVCAIDCDLGDKRNLDINKSDHRALFKLIQDKFSSYFEGGEFTVKDVFQHRKR